MLYSFFKNDRQGEADISEVAESTKEAVSPALERSKQVKDYTMKFDEEIVKHSSGWKLPTKATVSLKSEAEIVREFNRLDITGEGKLSYLTLKSALELREIPIEDSAIRRWIKDHDRGSKGFVDFADYQEIYSFASTFEERGSPFKADISTSINKIERDRLVLLKRAFDRYDIDGNGYISLSDLEIAFQEQSRPFTRSDLVTWIRKRDTSGVGEVSFQDFARHYR